MFQQQPDVCTVSEVTTHLKELLESSSFLSDLWIVGEVSNLRISPAGHAYFTLKDNNSSLNCVLFRGQSGAEILENGKSVLTHGRMSFYEPRGSTDFMVDRVLPEGEGELARELERLKAQLELEGLFEESRKRPLPRYPQVVGVVTSPTGAAYQDIQNVIRRRYPLVTLLLSPTQVQGLDAAPSIAAAINRLDRDGSSDVIILARGGGSLEDLWPFNEEVVARAIFRSRIPIVSGVGHETDFTIADSVADRRAPTPSAAAELVVPDGRALRQAVDDWADRAYRGALQPVAASRGEVGNLARRLETGLPDLDRLKRRIDDLGDAISNSLRNRLRLSRVELDGLAGRLRTLDPAATLRRGFAVAQRSDTGQVITGAGQVADGDVLTITVADGSFPATAGNGAIPGKASAASSPEETALPTPPESAQTAESPGPTKTAPDPQSNANSNTRSGATRRGKPKPPDTQGTLF